MSNHCMSLQGMILVFREFGASFLLLTCTICKTAKCYTGFILERAEEEPLEQFTCAAVDFHRMGHEEGTSSWKISLLFVHRRNKLECMTFQGTITGWYSRSMSSKWPLLDLLFSSSVEGRVIKEQLPHLPHCITNLGFTWYKTISLSISLQYPSPYLHKKWHFYHSFANWGDSEMVI